MDGITINMLKVFCEKAIADGYGNKIVLISEDDEGNGYHTLFYQFTTDENEIEQCAYLFHDRNNPKDVVLLG